MRLWAQINNMRRPTKPSSVKRLKKTHDAIAIFNATQNSSAIECDGHTKMEKERNGIHVG